MDGEVPMSGSWAYCKLLNTMLAKEITKFCIFTANVAPWRIGVYNVNGPLPQSVGFRVFYQQVPC